MKSKIRENRILALALVIIIGVGITITGVSAYLIFSESASNNVSVGTNELKIYEVFNNPELIPGIRTDINKKVKIKNIGTTASNVRVRVDFSDESLLQENGGCVTVNYDSDDWLFCKDDGYWYYRKQLAVDEETTYLFDGVVVDKPTAEEIRNFNIYVYAESYCIEVKSNDK